MLEVWDKNEPRACSFEMQEGISIKARGVQKHCTLNVILKSQLSDVANALKARFVYAIESKVSGKINRKHDT